MTIIRLTPREAVTLMWVFYHARLSLESLVNGYGELLDPGLLADAERIREQLKIPRVPTYRETGHRRI